MGQILTGRITKSPDLLLHEEILKPQFTYEAEHLLTGYLQIEEAMLLEYVRMGHVSENGAAGIIRALQEVTVERMVADPKQNMSDIAFAIERLVEDSLAEPEPRWHMDRSRNDFQACAQLMFGRKHWLSLIERLVAFSSSLLKAAQRYARVPMPGYTHYQSAQIITPGFYMASIHAEITDMLDRWLRTYDAINQCPLGAGAMAGVELDWDRERLASLLGFEKVRSSALNAVASRGWALLIGSELSLLSVLISRFATDLITWGSSEYNFLDLPDQFSGISSAMPQKKNFPVLERIRGRSAHLSAFYMDLVIGQRNTAYTNLVETSKEAGTHVLTMFETTHSLLLLFTAVIEQVSFNEERMLELCMRDYFGGFSLANQLCLEGRIPYRKAQVIVGRYIKEAVRIGIPPYPGDAWLLQEKCAEEGFSVQDAGYLLATAFDVNHNLNVKVSSGSTNPEQVLLMLSSQKNTVDELEQGLKRRCERLAEADEERRRSFAAWLKA
jgi:argininosuccinate lyase